VEGVAEPRRLSEGTMLDDKYRIDRLLAVGGMGAVYVGTHIKLRKRVAIKVINPQLSSAPMIERFHREAITASQIGHEGIAQVTDIGTSGDGEPFLVMEFLEGESLASRLCTSGPLPIEDACELGCSILSPLAAAHRAGIVHRDLKPDNVFLVRQSRGEMVKLLDFGISRAAGLESEFRLTTTGLVLGTPYYMSPEQARGDSEITPAADLYAIGVILYEMLVGNVPIQAENYNQLMYRVMIGDYARPRALRPDLPEALELVILQAMAQAPEHRPASAVELEQALMGYCRPAFRERASGRISSPGLPPHLPSASASYGTGSGVGRGNFGTDHTLAAAGSHVAAQVFHGATTGAPAAVTSPERPSARAPRRSKAPWIAGVIVLGAIAAVAGVVATRDPTTTSTGTGVVATPTVPAVPTPPVAPAVPAPPTAPSAPPPVAPVATPPAAPATVTLRFAVDPAGAVITVDGAPVHGTELVVPRDSADHALQITAPGRVSHEETIRFDESQRLAVQLPRATGPVHSKPPRPQPGDDRDGRIDSKSPY
jgi:eukaryotic-like serine/threonine-protein kinase